MKEPTRRDVLMGAAAGFASGVVTKSFVDRHPQSAQPSNSPQGRPVEMQSREEFEATRFEALLYKEGLKKVARDVIESYVAAQMTGDSYPMERAKMGVEFIKDKLADFDTKHNHGEGHMLRSELKEHLEHLQGFSDVLLYNQAKNGADTRVDEPPDSSAWNSPGLVPYRLEAAQLVDNLNQVRNNTVKPASIEKNVIPDLREAFKQVISALEPQRNMAPSRG